MPNTKLSHLTAQWLLGGLWNPREIRMPAFPSRAASLTCAEELLAASPLLGSSLCSLSDLGKDGSVVFGIPDKPRWSDSAFFFPLLTLKWELELTF